jgi:methyl-accepting chemotaxis protein
MLTATHAHHQTRLGALAAMLSRLVSLRNLNLAGKFGLISTILIIGFAALGAAYWQVTTVNNRASTDIETINHFGELADQINIRFLEMRRLEKDFIIDKDEALLEQHETALRSVESLINEILQNPPTEETASLLEDMQLYLGLYEGSFKEMAQSMIEAGLDERSGYLGQLIGSANNIFDLVSTAAAVQLQNSLLTMRQYERSFIQEPLAEYSDAMLEEKSVLEALLDGSGLDDDTQLFIRGDLETYAEAFMAYGDSVRQLTENRSTFSDVALEFTPILDNLRATKTMLLDASRAQATADQGRISLVFVGIIVLVGVVVNIAFFMLSRIISLPLRQAVDVSAAIANGRLDNRIVISSQDETGELLLALRNMQEQLLAQQDQLQQKMEEARRSAEESNRMAEEQSRMAEENARIATANGRIRQALDGVSSAVLMLDAELRIIYHNDAAITMFRQGRADMARSLPGFDPEKIIGQSYDYLYTDALTEGQLLRNLRSTHSSEKQLGTRTYRITVSPVVDERGQRIGTVAEWQDRTTEIAVENEVQGIVQAAKGGNLGNRIDLRNKAGFFHSLSQGVNELMTVAEQVIQDTVVVLSGLAQGDLTHTMNGDFDGVFATLKSDVNATVKKLTEVVSNIQNGARSVNKVASEIAMSNAEVSMRTEQQAAVLEETASAMEEMTAIVRQTAANTVEANKLANAARTQAEAGGNIVSNAVSAMKDISQSSNQIANIIGVIDEISFQTNLLALNAAVEAARAGEQGRGFAVVADEVRQLAAHSANAAKEIEELIDHSNKQVLRGSELVNKSGEALTEIVKAVKQVTTIISEIAVASQEQADGIAQVNVSIANMDEGTQQNAAMVEQVKSASDSMGEEAQRLNLMMDFFKLEAARAIMGRPVRH